MIVPRTHFLGKEPQARARILGSGWVRRLRKEVRQTLQLLFIGVASIAVASADNNAFILSLLKLAFYFIKLLRGALAFIFVASAIAFTVQRWRRCWFYRRFDHALVPVVVPFTVSIYSAAFTVILVDHVASTCDALFRATVFVCVPCARIGSAVVLIPDLVARHVEALFETAAIVDPRFRACVPLASGSLAVALILVVNANAHFVLASARRGCRITVDVIIRELALGLWARQIRCVARALAKLWTRPAFAIVARVHVFVELALARGGALERCAESRARNVFPFLPADAVCPGAAVGCRAVTFPPILVALWLVVLVNAGVRACHPLARCSRAELFSFVVPGARNSLVAFVTSVIELRH